MTQQTTGQARVIDPILTTHAQGYVRPGNVAKLLFPIATVMAYGGQVLEFGKEGFRRYNTKRAPGAETATITFGYAGKPYTIISNALNAILPREHLNDAAQVPGIDLASDAVDVVLDVMELSHEYDSADLARDAARYDNDHKVTLTAQDRWKGTDGDPTADIKAASEAIRKSIGVRPNTVILSPSAFSACEINPKIIDRLKYTGRDSVTVEMLAKLWNVKTVAVGDAVGASGTDDDFGDVWGNDVVVAYVAPPSGGNRRSAARPSYGYTYAINGMPMVERPHWNDGRKSWIYGVTSDMAPVLSGITAGYLIKDAGADPV